MKLWR